jgi:hypothetical protein
MWVFGEGALSVVLLGLSGGTAKWTLHCFPQHTFPFSAWCHGLCYQHREEPSSYSFQTAVNMMTMNRAGYQLHVAKLSSHLQNGCMIFLNTPKLAACWSIPYLLLTVLPLFLFTSLPSIVKQRHSGENWDGHCQSLICSPPSFLPPSHSPSLCHTAGNHNCTDHCQSVLAPDIRVNFSPWGFLNLVTISHIQEST